MNQLKKKPSTASIANPSIGGNQSSSSNFGINSVS